MAAWCGCAARQPPDTLRRKHMPQREERKVMTGDLFHRDGSRKYLTQEERQAFLTAAAQCPHPVRSFCYVLTYTGQTWPRHPLHWCGIKSTVFGIARFDEQPSGVEAK